MFFLQNNDSSLFGSHPCRSFYQTFRSLRTASQKQWPGLSEKFRSFALYPKKLTSFELLILQFNILNLSRGRSKVTQ